MGVHKRKRQTNKCQPIFSFVSLSIPARNSTVCRFRSQFNENESSASPIQTFRHAVFSFVVVDILYSSYMRRFWFDFVQKDLNYYEPIVLSLDLFFLTCCVNSWILGWNEVKYREINCILTKSRTNNGLYLPSKLRLINMKLLSFSYLASYFLYCLESSTFTFKDAAAFTSLAFLDTEIFEMVGN